MTKIDVTGKIERLEVFEERLGVRLDSLSAFVAKYNELSTITVCGELQARDGTELQQDVELVVAVYDLSGRIIGTASYCYFAKNFFGLETFEILAEIPVSELSKVRVYPKKS
jgi:hypothetical protein